MNFRAVGSEIFDQIKDNSSGKFWSTFFKRLQSSSQRLDLMRELQLSLPCFKKTKLASAFWTCALLPECREAAYRSFVWWLNSETGMKERNPSLERKGLTPSEQPAGRSLFEAQGGVSPSAEGDLRNFSGKVS